MRKISIIILALLVFDSSFGQSNSFIDSLKTNGISEILLFRTNCGGCVVLKPECESYVENGNAWDQYVVWRTKNTYNIMKFNRCGKSKPVKFSVWKNDPFTFIKNNVTDLDTTQIQNPLSYSHSSKTWFETKVNHFKSYQFSFPTYSIDDKKIKDYAFKELSELDESLASKDIELEKNIPRYKHNNQSSIKKLLDILLDKLNTLDKRLRIN